MYGVGIWLWYRKSPVTMCASHTGLSSRHDARAHIFPHKDTIIEKVIQLFLYETTIPAGKFKKEKKSN